MFICTHRVPNSEPIGLGKTLDEAFKQFCMEADQSFDIRDCLFYNIGKALPVKMTISIKVGK
jgi:hypothetical protein